MIYYAIDCESWLDTMIYPKTGEIMGRPPKPVCWSIATVQSAKLVRSTKKVGRLLTSLLRNPNVTLVGQNIAFDLSCAVRWLGVSPQDVYLAHKQGRIKDTMVREVLIDTVDGSIQHGKSYSLAELLYRYTKGKVDKRKLKKGEDIWRLRYNELDGVAIKDYPQDAYDYALGDAVDTLYVFAKQRRRLAEMDSVPVEEEIFQTLTNWTTWLVGCMSPFVDSPRVKRFGKKHKKIVARFEKPFAEVGFLKWNPNRYAKYYPPKHELRGGYSEVRKVVQSMIKTDYERRGLEAPMTDPSKTFPNGQVQYSADALLGCGSRALREYGRTAKDRKLVNAFVPMLEQASGRRVMPRYNVLVATGRMSCKSPNLQQIPRAPGARECFIPREGYSVACLDYDSFEMFGLAQTLYWLFDETFLLETLNNRKDPHLIMVAKITGREYKEVVKDYHADDTFVTKCRQLAKIINFGAGGGMGAPTFLKNLDEEVRDTLQALDPDEELIKILKNILMDWRDNWNMHAYFDRTSRRTRKGRKFEIEAFFKGRVRGNLGYTDGNNQWFQGICADAFKHQANQVMEEIYCPGHYLNEHGVELGILLHDENMLMGPTDNIEKWASRTKSIMIERGQEVMPDCELRVGIEITGNRWMKNGITLPEFNRLKTYSNDVESFIVRQRQANTENIKYSVEDHLVFLKNETL